MENVYVKCSLCLSDWERAWKGMYNTLNYMKMKLRLYIYKMCLILKVWFGKHNTTFGTTHAWIVPGVCERDV